MFGSLFDSLKKESKAGDSCNMLENYNPKVASSNLATATTNPHSP